MILAFAMAPVAEYKVADLLRRMYGPRADKVDLALLTG